MPKKEKIKKKAKNIHKKSKIVYWRSMADTEASKYAVKWAFILTLLLSILVGLAFNLFLAVMVFFSLLIILCLFTIVIITIEESFNKNLVFGKKEEHPDKCDLCGTTKAKKYWDYKDGSTICDKCEKKK